jgi:hypothetical protein
LPTQKSHEGNEAMSTWPDPNKPGVPLHPERDGWHWIVGWSDKLFVAEWDSDQQDYVWVDGGDDPSGMVENGWTYAGPVLTPSEADALRTKNARMRAAIHLNTDLNAVRAALKGQL